MAQRTVLSLAVAMATAASLCGGEVRVVTYNTTAGAGLGTATANITQPRVALPPQAASLTAHGAGRSLVFTGRIKGPSSPAAPELRLFGVAADAGYARLWVDDHLLVDAPLSGGRGPAPVPVSGGYTRWPAANIDTPGRTMKEDGGDCPQSTCGTADKCQALCDSLRHKGCIGFVADPEFRGCFMRKLLGPSDSCEVAMAFDPAYSTYTNGHCFFAPGWRPSAGGGHTTAKYAIPVPFFPGKNYSRFRLEFTLQPGENATRLQLLANASEVVPSQLTPDTASAELRYFSERAAAEVGWNTWLSGDMLTHALLPHGLAVQLIFESSNGATLTMLGNSGPSCDRTKFPVTHGLHAQRGTYTELQSVDFDGAQYRVQTAAATASDPSLPGDLAILVTTLAGAGNDQGSGPRGARHNLVVRVHVPDPWKPRMCTTTLAESNTTALAQCPGLPQVHVRAAQDVPVSSTGADNAFSIALPTARQAEVALVAGRDRTATVASVSQVVVEARARLQSTHAAYGVHNQTFAGMQTAISWNVIYTPYEGIVTPVFRGSPWTVSKPHNYVLFEWVFHRLVCRSPLPRRMRVQQGESRPHH